MMPSSPNIVLSSLNGILKQIKIDLPLGSANKKSDGSRTGFFSDVALEYTRLKPSYTKKEKKYHTEFKALLINPNSKTLPFVDDGARGKAARAGNCQEKVGLALYYLMKKPDLWKTVEVVTLDKCFDHVFLKITTKDNQRYYFDPWAELSFNERIEENVLEICNLILDGYEMIIQTTTSQEEREAFEEDLADCKALLLHRSPKINQECSFLPKEADAFIKQFEDYYQLLINELFPKTAQLPKP